MLDLIALAITVKIAKINSPIMEVKNMNVKYEIWRCLVGENEYGDIDKVYARDKLYETNSSVDAWNKYFELRPNYVFRWTKHSISFLKLKRIEL